MAKRHDSSAALTIFARNLRQERTRAKLTQKKLARAVNIAEPVYWKYEAARHWPSLPTFSRLCDVLECSADALLEGMEPPFVEQVHDSDDPDDSDDTSIEQAEDSSLLRRIRRQLRKTNNLTHTLEVVEQLLDELDHAQKLAELAELAELADIADSEKR